MNSSESEHFFDEVDAKRGKMISYEELSRLIEAIRHYSVQNGQKW